MTLTIERIKEALDEEYLIDLLQRLIQVRSVSPPGNEGKIAAIIAHELASAGIQSEEQVVEQGRPNLIAVQGEGSGPVLMLNAHMDTVPAGDENQWTFGPFDGVRQEGRIYGRGAVDDKGGLAAMTTAMILLKQMNVPLNGRAMLTAVMGEEVGHIGTRHMLASGVKADMAIVGEWSSSRSIALGYRGRIEIHLQVTGRSAHGSRPEAGVNAIDVMAQHVLPALKEIEFPHEVVDMFVAPHPTLSVGMIRGGERINMVPDSCSAAIDMRLVVGQDPNDVINRIEEAVQSAIPAGSDASVQVAFEGIVPPFFTNEDTTLVQTLSQSIRAVTGAEPRYFAKTGSSDANLVANRLAIPVVAYGPGNTTGHQPDEYVEIEDLIETCAVYVLATARLLAP